MFIENDIAKLTRILSAIVLSCFSLTRPQPLSPVTPPAILLKSAVTDTAFRDAARIRVEILETGDTAITSYGQPFFLKLPPDTLWNLCLNSDSLEKCVILKYLGSDSVFSAEISSEEQVTWFSDQSVERLSTLPDSISRQNLADSSETASFIQSESTTQLRKVVVQLRKRPKRRLGESVVSAKSIRRLPGLAEADVIRTIQALPGVVASSDFSTKIYVRGGGSDQNLFLLDNAVVYSPVHFFGLFSTFLVEAIDDVKFYKSGFAPQYGNRLSSVVDIRSRNGGSDSADAWFEKSSVKISTFAAQMHTEGRQGNTRWIVAGRSTYIKQMLDLFYSLGATDFRLDYQFTDVQGSVRHSFEEDRSLAFSVYTGKDRLNFDPLRVDWGNTVIPLNLRWRLDEDWLYGATLAYSRFSQNFGLRDIFTVGNFINTWALKQFTVYRGIGNHEITLGLDHEYNTVDFSQDFSAFNISFSDRSEPWLHALYVQDNWNQAPWEIQSGMRLSYQNLSEHISLEPRFSASRKFSSDQTVNFHAGYYYQYLNSLLFSDMESLNEFYYPSRKKDNGSLLPPAASLLLCLGYTKDRLPLNLSFSAESYYKTQNDLVIYNINAESDSSLNDANTIASFTKKGRGYSFGYELSARRNEGALSGGLSWSQGWSVILEQFDSVPYYPDWHQPYALKADFAINWRGEKDAFFAPAAKDRYLRSSIQLKWASGLPYTEYLGYHGTYEIDQSIGQGIGGPVPEYRDNIAVRLGNRNTSLQKDYFRLDFKLIDMGKENKWNFSWTVLNVTNRKNIFFVNYDTSKNPPEENKITQFPFFPILLNYEYYF